MTLAAPVWLDAQHLSRPELLARISVACGTRGADLAGPAHRSFEPAARIARTPWVPVTEHTVAEIGLRLGRHRNSDTVALVALPAGVTAALLEARSLSRVPTRRAEADAACDATLAQWVNELEKCHGWRFDPAASSHAGFSLDPGDMPNTTTHSDSGRLVGLHLDSWDRLPPLHRHEGSNRICINLGAGDRSLQFVPCQAADLVAALKARGRDVTTDREALRDSSGRFDLARVFLETCPDVPVVRLRMHPGEAYIAPTENLIHDGCAESHQPDLTLTVRGRIEALP